MKKEYTVGVFDSGVGGKSVAQAIKRELTNLHVVYVSDAKNVPYGSKTPDELFALVLPILKTLAEHVDVIVIACNSVSTTLAPKLRESIPIPIVAMEPMVKPASEKTQTGIIAVCATPVTLQSSRYAQLKRDYAAGIEVLEPDCNDWSMMIESNTLSREKVKQQIDECCERGADVIVLGCTHYHWIEDIIKQEAADRAIVLQPEIPVIAQLERVIGQLE